MTLALYADMETSQVVQLPSHLIWRHPTRLRFEHPRGPECRVNAVPKVAQKGGDSEDGINQPLLVS